MLLVFFKMHLNCNLTKIGKRNQLGILYCNMINKFYYHTKGKFLNPIIFTKQNIDVLIIAILKFLIASMSVV
jgi:hypothetical protein